jgi:dimeric dUTPase (all-alpha-NTP-PPase superfamily)
MNDDETTTGDRLALMMATQTDLQRKSYGADPADLAGDERAQYIRDMMLALEDELHEALAEVGWKPWATSRHLNRDAYLGEMVDAWHFFMNLLRVAKIEPAELFAGYMEKAARNAKRQADGYDGVAGKCPGCGRALDDPAVRCGPSYSIPGKWYCIMIGYVGTKS